MEFPLSIRFNVPRSEVRKLTDQVQGATKPAVGAPGAPQATKPVPGGAGLLGGYSAPGDTKEGEAGMGKQAVGEGIKHSPILRDEAVSSGKDPIQKIRCFNQEKKTRTPDESGDRKIVGLQDDREDNGKRDSC